jgi:4-aminobutyrate aminotransferase-like enzyme
MGSSGKNWGHDQWYLSDEQTPDFVTFGGKSGLGGFYSTLNYRLNNNATKFHQNINMSKLLHYGAIWKTISRDNILHWQGDTSTFLKIELDRVSVEKPGLVKNVRGYGTHLGFDSDKPDSLQRWFYKTGF